MEINRRFKFQRWQHRLQTLGAIDGRGTEADYTCDQAMADWRAAGYLCRGQEKRVSWKGKGGRAVANIGLRVQQISSCCLAIASRYHWGANS